MFSISDVKGISLQMLMSYIVEKNKEEKQYSGENELGLEEVNEQEKRMDDLHSVVSLGMEIDDENSKDAYDKETDEINESEDLGKEVEDESIQLDNSDVIMVTKPSQQERYNLKSTSLPRASQNQSQMHKPQIHSISRPLAPIDMKSLVLSLKNNTIDMLKQQFFQNNNNITVQRFLWLMRQCISYNKQQEYEILYQLIKLFQAIDIDCNGFIDWQQFLQYLSCYGWASSEAREGDRRGKKGGFIVDEWRQENKHRKNHLSKIIQVERMDMLCLVESRNFTLSFLNTRGEKYTRSCMKHTPKESNNQEDTKNLQPLSNYSLKKQSPQPQPPSTYQFSLNHINHKKVLAIDYSEHQKLFGVLQTDRMVYFVQQGEIQKSWGKIQGTGNQIDIMYLPLHKKWLLKRIDQYIDVFASPKEKYHKERITFKPHQREAITSIKQLKNPLSLVTAGIDGKIKIWSLAGKQLLIELKPIGQQESLSTTPIKTKGVKGIDTLNIGTQSYFCSWTFTTEIMLWLPSASVSKPYLGKLHGHSGIVQSCEFVRPHHCPKLLLISIDNKKVIKIWSVEKMQCIQSLLHQGNGCRVKCLSGKAVVVVYDKVMEFRRLKLSSLMIGDDKEAKSGKDEEKMNKSIGNDFNNNKKKSFPLQQNLSPNSTQGFLQLQFCTYNILMLQLSKSQLRIISLRSGRVQSIIEPQLRDEEQFVYMTLKINRRAFIVSSLGFVYYVKIDDGSLIQRIEVTLSVKQPSSEGAGLLVNRNLSNGRLSSNKQSMKGNPKFMPKFIHYHSASKILLIVVQLDDSETSCLITYDESSGYEFEKMKQIHFHQTQLNKLLFFKEIDVMLIVSQNVITVWDWKKLNVVNVIDVMRQGKFGKDKLKGVHKSSSFNLEPSIKNISIYQSTSNQIFFIMVLTKSQQFFIYQITSCDYSIKLCMQIEIPSNIKSFIQSFHLLSTKNQEIDSMMTNKTTIEAKSKQNNPINKQKTVKFNSSGDQDDAKRQNENIKNSLALNKKSPNNLLSTNNANKTLFSNSPNNSSAFYPNSKKGSQKNTLMNRNPCNNENNLLYITLGGGSLIVFTMNEIIEIMIRQGNDNIAPTISKNKQKDRKNSSEFINNSTSDNMLNNYAAHKTRQIRNAPIKTIQTDIQKYGLVSLEEHFLLQKQSIGTSWGSVLGELYSGLVYGVTQKQEIVFMRVTGQVVGEWSVRSMMPKRWSITYQVMQKVLERLNLLEEILKVYNKQQNKPSFQRLNNNRNFISIDGSQESKIVFLANRYLKQTELADLRSYVKMSTKKLINASKKNLLFQKDYNNKGNEQKARIAVSMKKIDDMNDVRMMKKSLTINKNVGQLKINDRNATSIKNITEKSKYQPSNQQSNKYSLNSLNTLSTSKVKGTSQKQLNGNYFEQRFEQRVKQQNRISVNKKFIDKQVQKTLNHAKKLQLKTIENSKTKQRFSLGFQTSSSQKPQLKQLSSNKKQHAKQLIQQFNTNLSPPIDFVNNFSQQGTPSQMNNLLMQQELQKKEILKNINFVQRIQNSIKKIQQQYTTGWLRNQERPEISVFNQKEIKIGNYTKNSQIYKLTNNIPDTNILKIHTANTRTRKVSIINKIISEQESLEQNPPMSHQEPAFLNVRSPVVRYSQASQNGVNKLEGAKKNAQFSMNNQVIYYGSSQVELANERRRNLQKSKTTINQEIRIYKNNKPIRSFSAAIKFTPESSKASYQPNSYNKPSSPVRKNMKSASIHHSQQKLAQGLGLTKSKSFFGTQFAQQKEFAINNFRQGTRQFQTFFKRLNSGLGKDNVTSQKKNPIRLS